MACLLINSYGQDYSKINLDSLYQLKIQNENKVSDSLFLLNIHVTLKLKILKTYKNSFSTPALNIDFPYSNYDSVTKTLSILRDNFSVSESTTAVIRAETWVDESFGSGGSGYIKELSPIDKNSVIDSLIKIDSISTNGIFYLTINNSLVRLEKNMSYTFDTHKQEKTKEVFYDLIREYSIDNFGNISRNFKYGY
jgi:hypothetical protein